MKTFVSFALYFCHSHSHRAISRKKDLSKKIEIKSINVQNIDFCKIFGRLQVVSAKNSFITELLVLMKDKFIKKNHK